jgi:hypothetical protein
MNIFFNNSSSESLSPKVTSSQDIPNINDNAKSDYFHYIDFTIDILTVKNREKLSVIIEQKLLTCISKYRCNTIILNKNITQNNHSLKHMILKFLSLIDLINFVDNLSIPICINSIRCIHNKLLSNIQQTSEYDEPISPTCYNNEFDHHVSNDDPDHDGDDHDSDADPDCDGDGDADCDDDDGDADCDDDQDHDGDDDADCDDDGDDQESNDSYLLQISEI